MSDIQEIEAFLSHYGVKGMQWGVRRGSLKPSSGSSRVSESKNSPEELERRAAIRSDRIKLGKEITKNVLIAFGTVAVASVAGPVVAAGAGAIARSLPGELFQAPIQPGDPGYPITGNYV